MSSVSGRIYTVKKINAALYRFQNIGRRTDPHQINWFFYGQIRYRFFNHMIHLLMALSYRKAAQRISVQIKFGNPLRMCYSDIVENSPLIDTEQHLMWIDRIYQPVQSAHLFFTAFQPPRRAFHRVLNITSVRHAGRTFIKRHRNRRSQIGLYLHTFLRTHENFPAVDMRMKIDAFFFNLAKTRQ